MEQEGISVLRLRPRVAVQEGGGEIHWAGNAGDSGHGEDKGKSCSEMERSSWYDVKTNAESETLYHCKFVDVSRLTRPGAKAQGWREVWLRIVIVDGSGVCFSSVLCL